ncbi:unnamed protein product [Durusdinium trenchii]|uniref:Peptidase A1 domain-containing protein n=1 Tax=Durusdinium trenchii TaxID=1381693 RepID=A0ABP0LAE5_9DINO
MNALVRLAELRGSLEEGVYYTEVMVGSPRPQNASLIVDTASWITEMTCAGCKVCGKHINPQFDIARSRTASLLSCRSVCPGLCHKDKCTFKEKYLEGSSLEGLWFQDQLRFDPGSPDGGGKGKGIFATFGCSFKETGLFASQRQNGILGLAPGSEAKPTLVYHIFKKAERNSHVFTLCLRRRGGYLTFGQKRSHGHAKVPLAISSHGKYSIQVQGMKVNGKTLQVRLGKAQLDSASTLTYLPPHAEKVLRRAIEEHCGPSHCGHPPSSGGDEVSRSCWRQGKKSLSMHRFPVLSWILQGMEVQWMPSQYLLRHENNQRLCYTFRPTEVLPDGSQVVLGASWMINQELLFDIGSKRLGLWNSTCQSPALTQPTPLQNLRGRAGKWPSPTPKSFPSILPNNRTQIMPFSGTSPKLAGILGSDNAMAVLLLPKTEMGTVWLASGLVLAGTCASLCAFGRRALWRFLRDLCKPWRR